jgi:tetratricopeptide (TPR) repeat protein
MAIDDIAEQSTRAEILRELRVELGDAFESHRSGLAGADAWGILSRCMGMDAVRQFVDAVALVVGETRRWRDFSDLADQLFPVEPLLAADRIALVEILREVPADVVAAAVAASGLAEPGDPESATPADGAATLVRIETEVVDGRLRAERLWQFLEAVAHRADTAAHVEIHRAVLRSAAYRGAHDEVRSLCERAVRDLAANSATPRTAGDESDDNLSESPNTDTGADEMPSVVTMPQPSAVAVPAVMRGLAPRNAYFAGRVEVLERIRRTLEAHGGEAAVLPQALYGLGGVGKTQVALEYAYRNSGQYELVFWVPAEDEQTIRRSMISLGKAIDVPDSTDAQDTIDLTLDMLRAGRPHSRWLLIFDNATHPKIVRKYIPAGDGHVIVTSRSGEWRSGTEFIEIDVFTEEESTAFLKRRWPSLTKEEAVELANRLDRLPLALNQAAAFHAETGMPLAEYLANYDELVATVTETAPTDYPEPVAATWRLGFDALSQNSPAAAQLLQLCCFLSSEPIAIPMLRSGRGASLHPDLKGVLQNELAFRRAVQELGRYALAQIDTTRDFITVHSLVRAVLRDALEDGEREEAQKAAHEVLAFANPGDPDDGENWTRHRQIAPHVQPAGIVLSDDAHVRQILIDQIRFHFSVGDYGTSRQIAQHAVENWRSRLGADDVMTLRARFHLGNALRMLGDYESSRMETQETYSHLKRTLGADHEYTLAVANGLGSDLRFLGEFKQAYEQDTATLAHHRRLTDADDVSALRAANNVAVDLRLLGRFAEAQEIDEDNVRRRIVADPTNADPETLGSITNLVRDLIGQGLFKAALEKQLERFPLFEQRLGPHRVVLRAYRNLSIIYRKLGQYDPALHWAEMAERASRETRGLRHEETLGAATTLFNTLRVRGDLGAALRLGNETLAAYRAALVTNHPFTLGCAVDLGIVLRSMGMQGEARALDEASLAAIRDRLGDEHQTTLVCLANQSNNLALAGQADQAVKVSRDVYERSLSVRADGHPNTFLAAANLALDLDAIGDHKEAKLFNSTAVDGLRATLGPEHPETINVERGRRAETDVEATVL